MTTIDAVILAVAVLAAIRGALQGFLPGVLSLAGFLGGAFLGARLAPLVLHDGAGSPWSPLLSLAGAVMLGTAASVLLGTLGARLRNGLRLPGLATLDAVLGAVLGAAVAFAFVWIMGAVALQTPGLTTLRADVRHSKVISALNDALPPSGPILRALARLDPLPTLNGPSAAALDKPSARLLLDPDVRAAADGTVRITATACGLGIEGSGWVAASGIVVTNAHVVAGTGGQIDVAARGDGQGVPARAVLFDRRNDVAILAAPGLAARALAIAPSAAPGTAGAILGYPENGPFTARAARIGTTQDVLSQDAYGQGRVLRRMTTFRGVVRHGNSGGPIVDDHGRVVATVFAQSRSSDVASGFAIPDDVVGAALSGLSTTSPPVSTGPCA